MKRILVPTDFSSFARRAAERAVWVGMKRRRQIHLVHVFEKDRKDAAASLEQERTRLEQYVAKAKGTRASVTATLLRGEPYVELVRHARDIEADFIVLGCKGAGDRPLKVLGRTAAQVARMAEIPVIVVRNPVKGAYKRTLVALPLDPSNRRLLRLAELASDPSALPLPALRAYHVPFDGLIEAGTEAEPSEHHKAFRKRALDEVRVQVAGLARHGIKVRPVLRCGDARAVILSEAAHMKAELVALGTHARSGLARILLGSVAEWTLVNATADVLVARPVRFTFELP